MMSLEEFQEIFQITLSPGWQDFFQHELQKDYFPPLINAVLQEYNDRNTVYPPFNQLWNAFILTPFENIKGVLIGQDPYCGKNQACGLSFSVAPGQKIPPSLKNIYKELMRTHSHIYADQGDLSSWARQGLLLLNSILTTAGTTLSHKYLGWEQFTDSVIQFINSRHTGCFFFLWGLYAKKKSVLITAPAHMIIEANHPSPLSRKPFVGCGCFTLADEFLRKSEKKEILW